MAPDAVRIEAELSGRTSRDAVIAVTRLLTAAGIETPAVDARKLVAAALAATTLDLLRTPDRRLTPAEARDLAGTCSRRLMREPVSRIEGQRGFYGRSFRVTPATLDPRPCSETLIDAVLEIASREGLDKAPVSIVDIGTGTGCLLLTLLAELPLATGLATDISADALAVARENAAALGLDHRVSFAELRYLDGLDRRFDILVSNPPYIVSSDIPTLEPEVRSFDPMLALDGGADGLSAYLEIAAGLRRVIPDGWAFFEVGAGQADDVGAILLEAAGAMPGKGSTAKLAVWNDLGGHERCVAIKTQS